MWPGSNIGETGTYHFCSVSEMVVVIYACIYIPMPHFLSLHFFLMLLHYLRWKLEKAQL